MEHVGNNGWRRRKGGEPRTKNVFQQKSLKTIGQKQSGVPGGLRTGTTFDKFLKTICQPVSPSQRRRMSYKLTSRSCTTFICNCAWQPRPVYIIFSSGLQNVKVQIFFILNFSIHCLKVFKVFFSPLLTSFGHWKFYHKWMRNVALFV